MRMLTSLKRVDTYLRDHREALLALVLVASVVLNVYLILNMSPSRVEAPSPTVVAPAFDGAYTVAEDAPYGVRSEVYTRYENGRWKTYATSTPITEEEMQRIRDDFLERERAMRAYFRRQEELMREFWSSFPL